MLDSPLNVFYIIIIHIYSQSCIKQTLYWA